MSYHTPTTTSDKKVLGGSTARAALGTRARMPQSASAPGGKSVNVSPVQLEKPVSPSISMDELGLATAAEKNRKGYLSTYLEGQTPINKISNFLGSKKL